MNTKTFLNDVNIALARTNIFKQPNWHWDEKIPIIKDRAYFSNDSSNDSFLAVHFNEVADTMAFTLIDHKSNIWGIHKDNRRGWHLHPVEDPEDHVTIEPLLISEIINRASKVALFHSRASSELIYGRHLERSGVSPRLRAEKHRTPLGVLAPRSREMP